jgi:hypothetical protein
MIGFESLDWGWDLWPSLTAQRLLGMFEFTDWGVECLILTRISKTLKIKAARSGFSWTLSTLAAEIVA